MDELLFARLAALLERGPVVLASVLATRGATPRKRGARMLVTTDTDELSVGGGLAEARVVTAARMLLARGGERDTSRVDLAGGLDSAGICGGTMDVALRRWDGAADRALAAHLAAALRTGESPSLEARMLGVDGEPEALLANERLLLVGGGHCALALHELARPLGFDTWVHDERADCFADGRFAGATTLCGAPELLASALDTPRRVCAVLLNREFAADVAALAVLARRPPAFTGMMGSRRRIEHVRTALGERGAALTIEAPVGIELGAQTPHEIAISILARLVAWRHARDA